MNTDTVAVDCDESQLVMAIREWSERPHSEHREMCLHCLAEWATAALADHERRIAAAVRHEHGERIAKAQEQVAEAVRAGLKANEFHHADAAADAVLECARLARDLSPPP